MLAQKKSPEEIAAKVNENIARANDLHMAKTMMSN